MRVASSTSSPVCSSCPTHESRSIKSAASRPATPLATTAVASSSIRSAYARALTGSFWTVIEIIGNALVCALVAWFATYIWSAGNFLSGMSAAHQSRAAFLAASVGTSHLVSAAMTIVGQAHILRSYQVKRHPTQSAGLAQCVCALLKETWCAIVVTELLIIACVYAVPLGTATAIALRRDYKIEFYVTCFIGHACTTAVTMNVRCLIKAQTENGHQHQQFRTVNVIPACLIAADSSVPPPLLNDVPVQPATVSIVRRRPTGGCRRSTPTRMLRFIKLYLVSYQYELPVVVSGLYVHVMLYYDVPSNALGLVLFAVGSLVLKVVAQEGAKLMLVNKHVDDIRVMCFAVGLPPILIDTQVRIVLQYAQSTNVAVSGIVSLGVVELVMRGAKLLWLQTQIKRRRRATAEALGDAIASSNANANAVRPLSAVQQSHSDKRNADGTRRVDTAVAVDATSVDAWTRRQWQLHTAELYTDMSAEYMAIGCSTLFLYFFGSHPKYMLEQTLSSLARGVSSGDSDTSTPSSSLSLPSNSTDWTAHVSASMALQIAVEMLVDAVGCAVEIHAGTDFAQLRQYRYFVVSFLANLAVANLQIAGIMYILAST